MQLQGHIVVLRLPVLQEDEGEFHPVSVTENWVDAIRDVREFTDDDTGYFKVSDLRYIGGLSQGCPAELERFKPKRAYLQLRMTP